METDPIWLGAGKGGQSAEASQGGQLLLLELLLLQPLRPWESVEAKLLRVVQWDPGEDGEAGIGAGHARGSDRGERTGESTLSRVLGGRSGWWG